MPGDNNHRKPYTMREMKQIVDYLAERRLYNEVRARKMWMDFANSGQIQRTWQSLKETFLKRILPDIHNPYYKLSVQQIASFKQEYDMESKNKAKLEIHTISDSSSNNGNSKKDTETPSTSKSKGDGKTSGEDQKCSKIESRTRSSTETLVLENIAENGSAEESETEDTKKSFRDCITYSEPLTPMLQEVLDDFTTDDEEPQMQIVEEPEVIPDSNTNRDETEKSKSKSPVEIRQSRSLVATKEPKETLKTSKESSVTGPGEDKSSHPSKPISLKLKKTRKGTWEAKESTSDLNDVAEKNNLEKNNDKSQSIFGEDTYNSHEKKAEEKATEKEDTYNSHETNVKENSENWAKAIENCSNTTSDTIIPNNQEALIKDIHLPLIVTKQNSRGSSSEFQSSEIKDGPQKKPNRKRSNSEVSGPKNKQTKVNSRTPEKSAISLGLDTSEVTGASVKSKRFSTENSKKDIDKTDKNFKKTRNHDDQQKTAKNRKSSDILENTAENVSVNSQEAGPSNVAKETQDPSEINPCLKSVSLFAEQFSSAKYSDQESDTENFTPNKVQDIEDKPEETTNVMVSELHEKSEQLENNNIQEHPKKLETQEQPKKLDTQEQPKKLDTQEQPKKLDTKKKSDETEIKAKSNENAAVANERSESKQDFCNKINKNKTDVVVLKSHSESSSDNSVLPKVKRTNGHFIPKAQRDIALANVFGFTSGGAQRKRTLSNRDRPARRYSHRRRTTSRHSASIVSMDSDSSSSDYSTLSDSDDHDSRRQRDSKFFQPKPYNIMTNPVDGTLFVVRRKKVYPLIKKYKNSQHLLTNLREIDSEETDSYWKKKYMEERLKVAEEKIRADELARLLNRVSTTMEINDEIKSPILQAKPFVIHNEQKQTNETSHSSNLANQAENKVQDKNDATSPVPEQTSKEQQQGSTVKIKFTKDNEIELECQWPHVQPVLEKMAQMFHKNGETNDEKTPRTVKSSSTKAKKTKSRVTLPNATTIAKMEIDSSGTATPICLTPVDPEVHDKVNKLESEIFKEIEEKDKSERAETDAPSGTNFINNAPRGKRGKVKQLSSPKITASTSKSSVNDSTSDLSETSAAKKRKYSNVKGNKISNKDDSKLSNKEESKIFKEEESKISKEEESKISKEEESKISKGEESKVSKGEESKISEEEESKVSKEEESEISKEEESKISNNEESTISKEDAEKTAEVDNLMQQTQFQSETVNTGRKTRQSTSRIEAQSDTETLLIKRQPRVPKKLVDVYVNKETRRKTNRSRSTSNADSKREVEIPVDDSQVRYKFPKSAPATRSTSRGRTTTNKEQKPSRNYIKKTPKIFSSPDTSSVNSMESTLGYQDSDFSPSNINSQRSKKNLSVPTGLFRSRSRSMTRRKPYPYLADDETSKPSDHDHSAMNPTTRQNSSVDYRSDSYQLLMPKITKNFVQLKEIHETDLLNEVEAMNSNNLSPLSIVIDNIHLSLAEVQNTNSSKTEDNSSNMSLPLSPELSVVENISVSKEMLSSLEDHPTINETQCNDAALTGAEYSKYFISELDAKVPLMEQSCELQQTHDTVNSESSNTKKTISESLLNQICAVDINKQLSSDSIDEKLRNLLLESAKKISQQIQTENIEEAAENAMEIDVTQGKGQKKTTVKKRCSTPLRKKKAAQKKDSKLKVPNIAPVVEEHMEFCSRGGRHSCPTVMNIISCDAATSTEDIDDEVQMTTGNSKGRRKKKDVIKVKITRPKDKTAAKEELKQKKNRARSCSRLSVCDDSGINETESVMVTQDYNDDVELIHNHSETCIYANECSSGDSVEIIESQSKSIISVDSNSNDTGSHSQVNSEDCHHNHQIVLNNAQQATDLKGTGDIVENIENQSKSMISVDSHSNDTAGSRGQTNSEDCHHNHQVFFSNALQATDSNAVKLTRQGTSNSTSATVYHMPPSHFSNDSLITEDLSDENSTPPQSKESRRNWYLFSEEETSNTNPPSALTKETKSVGANLNQIFTLTCAIPELSTIIESDGDSRRQTLNGDIGNSEYEFTGNSQSN